jgi:hypothetical protein
VEVHNPARDCGDLPPPYATLRDTIRGRMEPVFATEQKRLPQALRVPRIKSLGPLPVPHRSHHTTPRLAARRPSPVSKSQFDKSENPISQEAHPTQSKNHANG